jgi:hypothetical protein
VYIFAYPDATIESLKGSNALSGMFGGFLSTFRLLPQELLQTNLGSQLFGIIFPNQELVFGPNPQHPVFGYHYFGAFGFVFSSYSAWSRSPPIELLLPPPPHLRDRAVGVSALLFADRYQR